MPHAQKTPGAGPATAEAIHSDQRNRFGATPLVAAAANGFLEPVQLLAPRGANLRATTKEGMGALGIAVEQNHVALATWLAERVSPNLLNHPDGPSLHIAALNRRVALIPVLIKAGAKIELEHHDLTPLHLAVGRKQVDAVRELLDAGANPNFGGKQGAPPLSLAALVGDVKGVELLLERGAQLNGKNPQGGTAIRAAADKGNLEVVRFLLARGAESKASDSFVAAGCFASRSRDFIRVK